MYSVGAVSCQPLPLRGASYGEHMLTGVTDEAERVATTFIDMNTALDDLDSAPDIFNRVLDTENLTAG